MSLIVTMDEKGIPRDVSLDGKSIHVMEMDIQFRPQKPVLVKLEVFAEDNGGCLVRHPNGDPHTEAKTFYAVSEQDFRLLQSLKKK